VTEKRLLAVLGFLLALIGGILLLANALSVRGGTIDLEDVARIAVDLILGVAAVLCGFFIYKGRMSIGGLLTIVIGVVIMLVHQRLLDLEAILIVIGGILGIVGAEARTT
jgi:hypothetical protein